jgi:hypothetical protein
MDSDVPEPLRHFLAQLDELRSTSIPDMDRVGRLPLTMFLAWKKLRISSPLAR